jgi:CRISPR-associated endonuclease/helicase Cas3
MARQLMASTILQRRLAAAFEAELTDIHLDRLAVLAGIHDFGKALKGFQDKLEPPSNFALAESRGHVAEALAVLANSADVKNAIRLPLLSQWFGRIADALFVSICHHGEPVGDDRIHPHLAVISKLLAPTRYGHDPITEIRRLSDFLIGKFPKALEPAALLQFTSAAQHLFAGILMAADWMASGFAFDPGTPEQRAAGVLQRTVWSGWHGGAPTLDLLDGRKPRPAQAAMLVLPLHERLVVIEAPTGTGKTEAALIWASRLVEASTVDGMYFAVPTRSGATELHDRISRLLAAQHPLLKGKIVRALPGLLDTDDPSPPENPPDYPTETWAVTGP